jgi:chaperonin GroEL
VYYSCIASSQAVTGIEIVKKALSWPARQIATNAGEDGSIVGIIDPTKVVRIALQGAASIAGLLITTEAMVAELPKKQSPAMPPGGGMGGMDF